MASLILPDQVTIQLIDSDNCPVRIPNVLFRITAFARRKNDFQLQPFATDSEGLVSITKKELEAEATAHYDSGVMDYGHISACSPIVEIRMLTNEDIKRAVEARKIWANLLAGERDRWKSLEELLTLYSNANNDRLRPSLPHESSSLCVSWNMPGITYSHRFVVAPS